MFFFSPGFLTNTGLLYSSFIIEPEQVIVMQGEQWQPWGCMMHKYTRTDSERCFRYLLQFSTGTLQLLSYLCNVSINQAGLTGPLRPPKFGPTFLLYYVHC